jgi:hypothetical protein
MELCGACEIARRRSCITLVMFLNVNDEFHFGDDSRVIASRRSRLAPTLHPS